MELPALLKTMEAVEMRHPSADPSNNPVTIYLASLGPGSRRTMTHGLRVIAQILTKTETDPITIPWHKLQYQHVQAIRTILAERYAHTTGNKILSALRGVLRESWRLGNIDGETYHRITDIKPIPGKTELVGRSLDPCELLALVAVCYGDPSSAGVRDAAILALLYAAGLRRSEVVALDLADYDTETGGLQIVASKGNKAWKRRSGNSSRSATRIQNLMYWTKSADEILGTIARFCIRTLTEHTGKSLATYF